ncbi:hypothetical protein [Microscilla marina]|uniref:Uncharacterized protein n=1 Tax=Microscilla marina ATCC 23134 TaxID=313606 RepID=A1ZUW3_MICM2|nr:hypothetical protein [Microscilla marina]EAY25867.1 hypothetical protein M23134_07679 [Microscilla marina ATCC 23134]
MTQQPYHSYLWAVNTQEALTQQKILSQHNACYLLLDGSQATTVTAFLNQAKEVFQIPDPIVNWHIVERSIAQLKHTGVNDYFIIINQANYFLKDVPAGNMVTFSNVLKQGNLQRQQLPPVHIIWQVLPSEAMALQEYLTQCGFVLNKWEKR